MRKLLRMWPVAFVGIYVLYIMFGYWLRVETVGGEATWSTPGVGVIASYSTAPWVLW